MINAEETYKCGKCGICLAVCPIYLEIRDETVSPRAKVQLMKHYAEKNLFPSPHLGSLFNRCLMCGSCTAGCPSGVRHNALFMQMRDCMVADHGEAWKLKVLFHFLTHDAQLRLATRFAGIGRNSPLNHLLKEIKIGNIPIKRLPGFNAKPFRDQLPEHIEPGRKPAGTVIYFSGCATQYVYEAVGHAVVKVLTAMGFRVEIPKMQVCCGLPMFFHGNSEKVRHNILTNLHLLNRSDIRAVVTDCASCGAALRREYAHVLTTLNLAPDAALSVGEKVKDITEFVMENFEMLKPAFRDEKEILPVTYHAPCHLRNAQAVTTGIEELLADLPRVSYMRASDVNECCGGGGPFFYDHPEISGRMVQRKIRNAMATQARYWLTGCPGCTIHLSGNLPDDSRLTVLHPIVLIAALISPHPA